MAPPKTRNLVRGIRGAGRTTIRFMRPGDDFTRLSELHQLIRGEALDRENPLLHEGAGVAAQGFYRTGEAGFREYRRAPEREVYEAYVGASAVLVAEGADGQIDGLAMASPPAELLDMVNSGALDAMRVGATLMPMVVELGALAVAPERRAVGIGASLVKQVRELYAAGGYTIMYGLCGADDEPLQRFYNSRGFEVFNPDDGLRMGLLIHDPHFLIYPPQGERYFARALDPTYDRPLRLRGARQLYERQEVGSLRRS